jgi:sugar phosphate permease
LDGVAGYASWRWIFLLEGLVTVVVGLMAFFVVEDFPEKATFLTEAEQQYVIARLKHQGSDVGGTQVAEETIFEWRSVKDAFLDWQVYLSLFGK